MRGHPKLIGYQEEPHPWNEWVRTTTGRLSDKQLLRELIPVTPLGSAAQASPGSRGKNRYCWAGMFDHR